MNDSSPDIPLFWRIFIAISVAIILFIILWISANFKEPPGINWLGLIFLLMAYACFDTVAWMQQSIHQQLGIKDGILKNLLALFGSIIAGTVVFICLFYGFKWLDYWIDRNEPPMIPHMMLAGFIGLVMSIIFAIIQWSINWRHQYYRRHFEHEQFKKEVAEANLAALKNQLDPHFMFNNFNTLYYLIDQDSQLAKQFLNSISGIYRYILQNREKTLVSLEQEYEMALQYLNIMQQRYSEYLQLENEINPKDLEEKQVPPLVLQQLIENAFKHNRVDEDAPLTISFSCDENYLRIKNNVNKKRSTFSTQTGLKNIQKRYQFLTSNPVVISEEMLEFSVAIPLLSSKYEH